MRKLIVALFLLAPSAAFAADRLSPMTASVLQNALGQIGVTLRYDASYQAIPFPGGDVPMDRGVCTDVVVRAYRGAGIDLQLKVHLDMQKAFNSYPHGWGLSTPDPNIDHRRVLNLMVFFTRHGQSLPVSTDAADYKPGDIVTWKLPDGHPHIGLVTDKRQGNNPLIVHNIGEGAQLEDILFTYTITGHYRYTGEKG